MTKRELERRLKEASTEVAVIKAELTERKRDTRLPCQKCAKTTRIRDLVYLQTHWYVRPYGCTGGDYYREGEGQYACPKCGHINRLYGDTRKWIVDLKRLFKSVEEVYPR